MKALAHGLTCNPDLNLSSLHPNDSVGYFDFDPHFDFD